MPKQKSLKPIESGLSGATIISRLRRGHMVRRACWVKGFLVRICNERGFDKQGNAVFDEIKDNIYTHATNGYFMHIGQSSQPFAIPHMGRDGEGVGMLFADDWEDWGFIDSEKFEAMTFQMKQNVRARVTAVTLVSYGNKWVLPSELKRLQKEDE